MLILLKSKYSGITLCLLLMLFLTGCNSSLTSNEKRITENVMNKGDRITVFNDYGELTITAANGNKRYLTVSGTAPRTVDWIGDTVSIQLKERKKRYNGSLGLYCANNIKEIRVKNGVGPAKVKFEEAQLHFDTINDVEKWFGIFKHDEGRNYDTWSSDGLYVQWLFYTPEYWFFPKRTILHVIVFQIYVGGDKVSPYQSEDGIRYWYTDPKKYFNSSELLNDKTPVRIGGQKPSNLHGAQDDKIKVEQVDDEQLQKLKKSTRWF